MALLAYLAYLKDMLENCAVHEDGAVRVLAYFLGDCATAVYEAYNASVVSTYSSEYHEFWHPVINARIKRLLIKTVF